jgi:hypothetical protein
MEHEVTAQEQLAFGPSGVQVEILELCGGS